MLYRKLGKNGPDVSVLGFGCMRLPILNATGNATDIFDPKKPIDDEQATQMVQHAISQGINYFDTAYGYHGGQSETFLGKVLKGKREHVLLATKLPVWLVQKPEDFDRLLDEQLGRLDTPYLDAYLLHALGRRLWECMQELGILGMLDKARADGRVRQVGFSFHDDVRTFKEIVDAYEWDICQIQYNFFDRDFQAGREGLRYAAAKGMGMVVMEPLRGGKLTREDSGRNPDPLGSGAQPSNPGGMGAPLGLEPSRGVAGIERHEQHESIAGKPSHRSRCQARISLL